MIDKPKIKFTSSFLSAIGSKLMRVRVTLTLMRTLKKQNKKLLLANCMLVRMIWKAWNGMYVSPSMNNRMSHLEKCC